MEVPFAEKLNMKLYEIIYRIILLIHFQYIACECSKPCYNEIGLPYEKRAQYQRRTHGVCGAGAEMEKEPDTCSGHQCGGKKSSPRQF